MSYKTLVDSYYKEYLLKNFIINDKKDIFGNIRIFQNVIKIYKKNINLLYE